MTRKKRCGRSGAVALLLALRAAGMAAQGVSVQAAPMGGAGSLGDYYTRLLQLTGAAPLSARLLRPGRESAALQLADSESWRSPWAARMTAPANGDARVRVSLLDVSAQGTYNSGFAYGANDGALWAGRGVSAQVMTGARAQFGKFTVQVAPAYTWSENKSFALGALHNALARASPYADVWESGRIDRPQRFGEGAFSRGDAGESFARVDFKPMYAGVSNEALWWGPGVDNSLLMSNNAAGFMHAFLGTAPQNIIIGRLEALWVVGRLGSTNFWSLPGDTIASTRWTNNLLLVFEPRGLPGMYFGVGRVFYANDRYDPITLRSLLHVLQPFTKKNLVSAADSLGNDTSDQLLSLFARWVFPASGFEVYGEYGRNDHSWDLRDLFLEPDHSRALLVGARKAVRLGDGLLVLGGEATTLAQTKTNIIRAGQGWYVHHIVRRGYTQRGQVIGAAIGPGSDAQSFNADLLKPWGGVGLVIRRERENNDAFYRTYKIQEQGYQRLHDVKLVLGPRLVAFTGRATIRASLFRVVNYNRYTIQDNDRVNYFADIRVEMRAAR